MSSRKSKGQGRNFLILVGLGLLAAVCAVAFMVLSVPSAVFSRVDPIDIPILEKKLDTEDYDKRLLAMSHVATTSAWYQAYLVGTTTASTTEPRPLWPKRAVYPNVGALLPFNRIVAYYGNYYSRQMGALGEYDPDEMLRRLQAQVDEWNAADPSTPVIPAIHYIVQTAQAEPQKDGSYRLQMPDTQIDKSLELAERIKGIVFIDFQTGKSPLQEDLPDYEKYLAMPNVHLGIDPEFAMKRGGKPGDVIGTFDAADVNYAAEYLAELVRKHNLPPKVLVVHRFTQDMLTNYQNIKPLPEVQIVIQMDGWGSYLRKINTYNHVVAPEPVQFTGFKIFYKNDLKEDPPRIMTPAEVLKLTPAPMYIQYQ